VQLNGAGTVFKLSPPATGLLGTTIAVAKAPMPRNPVTAAAPSKN